MSEKQPVIRLNKDMREEILGNVIEGKFNTSHIKRDLANLGFDLIKEVHRDFRATMAPLVYKYPRRFAYPRDSFTIHTKRTRGNPGRGATIYLSDFFTPEDNQKLYDLPWRDRETVKGDLVTDIFEGEPEIRQAKGDTEFLGFIVPDSTVTVTKVQGTKFFKKLDELQAAVDNLKSLRRQTQAILNSCYTMKQLLEVWPGVVDYAPTIVPSPTKGVALVVRVEDIEALLAAG